MVTFRAEDLARIDEWAERVEHLPRAVAIRRAAIEAVERALGEQGENARTAAALAGG